MFFLGISNSLSPKRRIYFPCFTPIIMNISVSFGERPRMSLRLFIVQCMPIFSMSFAARFIDLIGEFPHLLIPDRNRGGLHCLGTVYRFLFHCLQGGWCRIRRGSYHISQSLHPLQCMTVSFSGSTGTSNDSPAGKLTLAKYILPLPPHLSGISISSGFG